MNILRGSLFLALPAVQCAAGLAFAADPPGIEIQRRQALQLQQTQTRFDQAPDVLTSASTPTSMEEVRVEETPCFLIRDIEWTGGQPFFWLKERAAGFEGLCLGAQSIRRLRDWLNQSLLEKGYITSRVVLPRQNISGGDLLLEFIPGRISAVRAEGNSIGMTWFPLAVDQSEPVSQSSLDHTLENLRRLPSQQQTRLELLPGEEVGQSELLIKHGKGSRWQAYVSLDDSGSRSTGKNQLSTSFSVDSPFGMYDQLTFTLNSNADFGSKTLGSRAFGVKWNVPIGFASVFLGYNQSSYRQTIAGFSGPIVYTGDSRNLEAGLGYTAYRSGSYKGYSQIKLLRKASKNYIDNVEIGVQGRDAVGWELLHQHKHHLNAWILSFSLAVKGSLPSRSRNPGIVLGKPDWDGHYRIHSINFGASRPFHWLGQAWRYQANLHGQHTDTPLPASEYFSMGGRYTVRGFDGEQTLASGSGVTWRNELGLGLPNNHEAYVALDAGRIAGEESAGLKQKHLAGAGIGLRGRLWRASYDLSLGWPIAKPESFTTRRPAVAAMITIELNE